MVTRAVHIEVAHDMSADSFLMAFHRFVARRGKPNVIYSDNGSNFTAAKKELREEVAAINSERVENDMLVEGTSYHHTHHTWVACGRLVRSVKTTLQALVADRLLTDEELLSYLAEVEKVLNDRPLTKMGSDPKDDVPITPSDLLLLRGNSSNPAIVSDNPLRRRWTTVQDLANRLLTHNINLELNYTRSGTQVSSPMGPPFMPRSSPSLRSKCLIFGKPCRTA